MTKQECDKINTEILASLEKMAHDAVASGSPGNTIREVTEADCIAIYRELWK